MSHSVKTTKYKRKPDAGIPVLRGVLSASRENIAVWCPFCIKAHQHGWEPDAPIWAISHRVAHCGTDSMSRLHESGYYIGILPKKMLEFGAL